MEQVLRTLHVQATGAQVGRRVAPHPAEERSSEVALHRLLEHDCRSRSVSEPQGTCSVGPPPERAPACNLRAGRGEILCPPGTLFGCNEAACVGIGSKTR